MKTLPLLIIGCGGVGRHLLQHIISCRSLHALQGISLRVIGVCDSSSLIVPSELTTGQLDDVLLSELCRVKSKGRPLWSINQPDFVVHSGTELKERIMNVSALLGKSKGLVLVDCTASSETVEMLSRAVHLGCCVALANKKPLTSTMEDYNCLLSVPRHLRFESTVGAGLPIIASITRMINSGDSVYRLIGSLSGTLGYVMSEVEEGKPLSAVVAAAKNLGFTEPDPRDDLSGMDVARKALILARLLGMKINMDAINIESLYPKEMGSEFMSVEEFLRSGLVSLDKDVCERVKHASANGNVLRYVCVIEPPRCEVGLKEVPMNSPLGRLRGSNNILEVYSRCYKDSPFVIQGAGAGNDTTAAGVLADIIDLQDLFS